MKKLILSAFVLLSLSAAIAQIEKGAWLAGGNAGFTSAKNFNSFYINPNIGYFFTKNACTGISFSYYNPGAFVSVGPFARGYLTPGDFIIFAHVQATYNTGKDLKDAIGMGVGPGLGYFFNDHVALEALALYNVPDFDTPQASSFSTNISLQVYFGRK